MNDFFLADDLSGALEVAAAFRHAGRSTVVTWTMAGWEACGPDEVVGFTTETRNAAPAVAAAEVTRAVAHGRARGGRLRFKKIDSTMRGPVAAELAAVAAALPETTILFTPANPHAGRTVRDGVLLVKGVPVAESEFGRDPVNPVKESSIRGVVPADARERVIALDVATDEDFSRAIVEREAVGGNWMAVGSGALARALVPRLYAAEEKSPPPPKRPVIPPGPVLFVCGSAHPTNRGQAARLAQERATRIVEVRPSDPKAAVPLAVAALRMNLDSAVPSNQPLAGARSYEHQRVGMAEFRTPGAAALHIAARADAGSAEDSRAALAAIIEAAGAAIAETGARRIMTTGGETARALCDALGIQALRVLGDIEPGLVLASATNQDGEWLMAIKPGGFGSEACWVRALDALRGAV